MGDLILFCQKMDPRDKKFCLPLEDFREIIPLMGGCLATDRILVDGAPVGYMFREFPTDSVSSGWTFMAGDETQEYADVADNWAIYHVNTICNYDAAIVPYVNAPYGSAFGREPGSDNFIPEAMPPDPD